MMEHLAKLFPESVSGETEDDLQIEGDLKASDAHVRLMGDGWGLDSHEYSASTDLDGHFAEISVESTYKHGVHGSVTLYHVMGSLLQEVFSTRAVESMVVSMYRTKEGEG